MTEDVILKKVEERITDIKKLGVKRIGIFGSCSRNEQTESSDIDILVHFHVGKKTFDNYMDLKFYLEELFNRKVDLVIAETIKPDLQAKILGSVKYAEGRKSAFPPFSKGGLGGIFRVVDQYLKGRGNLFAATEAAFCVSTGVILGVAARLPYSKRPFDMVPA